MALLISAKTNPTKEGKFSLRLAPLAANRRFGSRIWQATSKTKPTEMDLKGAGGSKPTWRDSRNLSDAWWRGDETNPTGPAFGETGGVPSGSQFKVFAMTGDRRRL